MGRSIGFSLREMADFNGLWQTHEGAKGEPSDHIPPPATLISISNLAASNFTANSIHILDLADETEPQR